MSGQELAEWQAFYILEPFGEERADMRAALLATILANVHRTKDADPYKQADFMAGYERKEYDEAEIARMFGRDVIKPDEMPPKLRQAYLRDKLMAIFGRFRGAERRHGAD